jgi:hypothetical protein
VELAKRAHLVCIGAAPVLPRRLEDGRQTLEPGVGEEDGESVADRSLADVLVPVAVRTERILGVVDVKSA